MAQELTSGLGRPLTWRDKLRNYMREQYGEQGAQFAEGLIGVSEEEQQMRSLQRRYGSELPEDAELDRSMRERLTDPSDIGGIDKLLMALSGTASIAPRLATAASATESAALLGDAQGSYKKGDTLGAGLQTGLALLPAGLGMLGRGASPTTTKGIDDLFPKPQPEVSMAGTPYTMSVPDEPLYFSKQTGRMGGGMDNKINNIFNSRQYPGHFTDKVSTGNGVSATVKGDRGVSGAEVVDNIVKDLQQSGVTGDDFLSNQPFSSPVRMEGVLDGEKIMFSSTPIGSDSYEVSIRSLGKDNSNLTFSDRAPLTKAEYRLDQKETGELFREWDTNELMNAANTARETGDEATLMGINKEMTRRNNPAITGRTRLDEIETDEISSLKNELYQKEAIRQREYSTMAPKSLSKLDNEIGKLKAQINALTGK